LHFGLRLRKLRESKNISQQALADDAEVAISTIQRIEQAKMVTNIDIVLSLAKALDILPEELFKSSDKVIK
jgi:transcriptional regulator with XRE-family HTH domain